MIAGAVSGGRGEAQPWRERLASPSLAGDRVPANLALYVDDVDAHRANARATGARIVSEPTTVDHGPDYRSDRNYAALDCEVGCGGSCSECRPEVQRPGGLATRGVPHDA